MIIWIDGELCDLDAARISPLDRGLTVGDGVFETLRVYDGTPFAWRRHDQRLRYSAEALGLAIDADDTIRRAAANAVIAANGGGDARLRITITAGEGPPGSSRAGATPRTMLVATPFTPAPESTVVVVAPWTRNERSATAGLKTISYASNVRALAYAEERGASEALFLNTHDHVCEATGSNVFAVIDGTLCTPPATAGCLMGVTRGLVLEVAAAIGVPVDERDLRLVDLLTADEVFLTSTTREVQLVDAIDGTDIVRGSRPVGARLSAAFTELASSNLDP